MENNASEESLKVRRRRRAGFAFFTLIQTIAAVFFLSDAIADLASGDDSGHILAETVIAVGLVFGAAFGVREFMRANELLQRREKALASATGASGDVIEDQFTDWELKQAERQVAFMALKGFNNSEISRIRGTAEGTVRAQMTRIYSKAGVSGRAQFAAYFVEDLLVTGGSMDVPATESLPS